MSLLGKISAFRIIPHLDTYTSLVEFVKKPLGKFLLIAVFSLFLFMILPRAAPYLAPLLLLLSLFPQYRHPLILIGTLASALLGLTWFDPQAIADLPNHFGLGYTWDGWITMPLLLGLVFTLSFLFYKLACGGQLSFMRGFIAWTPIVLLVLLGLFLSYVPLPLLGKAAGWAFFFVWSKYIWYQAYTLQEARLPGHPSMVRQFAVYQPYWYPSPLPISKSASYLARIECRDEDSLAICQLKALKLIMWATILNVVVLMSEGFFYGEGIDVSTRFLLQWNAGEMKLFLNREYLCTLWQRDFVAYFPPLDFALAQMAQGAPPPMAGKAWGSTVFYFFMDLCRLAVNSHVGVAICRMSGFYLLRNVYRPFESKSIADFFGRYFYYYRELLVTIFFYPTFFKFFKTRPSLRLFCAIFAAAGVGNTLFHFFFKTGDIMQRGIIAAVLSFHSFMFYGLILSLGIFFSQGNKQKKPVARRFPVRIFILILIICFYSVAGIFAFHHDIGLNYEFMLALLGIRL